LAINLYLKNKRGEKMRNLSEKEPGIQKRMLNLLHGRPKGAIGKLTKVRLLHNAGSEQSDPRAFLMKVVADEEQPYELRVKAASTLLPFFYSKKPTDVTVTAQPPSHRVDKETVRRMAEACLLETAD